MKNIFLIGMPSSGKSTLGKRIADVLHYRFIDTDKIIVREEGRSIPEIFAESGEEYFREVERRVLRNLKPGANMVVSTGGGMPCYHNNMEYIKATGVSVFLDVPVDVLARRIQAHAHEDRPLNNANDPELLTVLQKRYELRLPIYSQANIIISGETTEDELLRRLGKWL
ncbi:shikimate kinase [Spirosoma sp. KCTC 42546]|uniref:shikimate kinase n=1 Tax=Spirosoma sp. KCTC 42546 TaxID=2520506 RepID=UPI00115AADDA|nr:shikimate kinase [Spirosoma sp. KCTC 42546]QDK80224.1 shikimate kinase [Spirosoma sp. KCTC 42546]